MHDFFETACLEGQLSDVRFFLSNGHLVDARNAHGMSALMLAADTGQMGLSLLLLRFGANVDLINDAQQTASMIAHSRGHLMLAKLLCGKRERRLKQPPKAKRPSPALSPLSLVQLFDYGVRRGFLSDAQIYGYLPALRQQPTGFSAVCQALQSLGIVLRDRTPDLARCQQALPHGAQAAPSDLHEYATTLLQNLRPEPPAWQPSFYRHSKPIKARAITGSTCHFAQQEGGPQG